MNDLKFAFRQLLKYPGFTAVAVLTLALGIMATTAMYSVIHAVVLDPFPYRDVDHLMSVKVWDQGREGFRTYYSTDQFLEIAERSSIFEGVIASTISDVLWTGDGDPQRLRGNYGTPNTFDVMGVPPLLGRAITPADGAPEAGAVVVLGYRFWQRQFAGDPGVVGRELRLNDQVRTVVGVMPKRFMWRGADVYLPIVFQRGRTIEGVGSVHLLGRLKPGVTAARAETDLTPIIEELKRREPAQFPEKWRVSLLSFKETFPSSIRENLWILFGAVGLLLLIACANVSNLLLSKASSRHKEMALRSALGASRARLIRQLLTESLLLAGVGGALGVLLAFAGLRAILTLVPSGTIPDESEIALNTEVLMFALVISGMTSIAFGLVPALQSCASDLANPLREAARGLAGSARRTLFRKGLVVTEVALSLMLLVAASLMVRTFLAMQDVDLGFRPDRLLTMRVPLPEVRYSDPERRIAFFQELLGRVQGLPGVSAVGLNSSIHPMGNWGPPVEVVGSATQNITPTIVHQVNDDYPQAMGIALLQGRLFDEAEVRQRRPVVIVNQRFVNSRIDDRQPLGKVIRIPRLRQAPFNLENDSFQIVGVVHDTLNQGLTGDILSEIYLPFTIIARADRLVALTQGDPSALTRAIIGQVQAIDKNQPVMDVRTMDGLLRERIYAEPRFNFVLFSAFGGLGLVLAVIGVYGVMSQSVAQQTHDIGVRMAIGATPRDITSMFVKHGSKLLLIGLVIGLAGALLSVRVLSSHIGKISPFDPVSFTAVSMILLGAGLLACFWPARRAARIDPMEALRYE